MTEEGKVLLKTHEGLRLKPYRDTVGKLTIGYGRNLDDCGISSKEADLLLDYDVFLAESELKDYAWFQSLSIKRKDVLINMCFNMGLSRLLGFKNMIKALNAKDYNRAAEEMLDSKWAKQVKWRAEQLAEIMREG